MKLRLQALRALRWNYTWMGVWTWLRGAPVIRCQTCGGSGCMMRIGYAWPSCLTECSRCMGEGANPGLKLGWERIRDEPERVVAEQTALAEGVMG